MRDPERLASNGSDEQRALLRAARAVDVPASVQDQVRRAVEARLAGSVPRTRKRRRLLALGAGGVLVAAAAAAGQGQGGFERLWRAFGGDDRPAQAVDPADGFAPRIAPAALPDPPVVSAPHAAAEAPAQRPRVQPTAATPEPPPPAGPREEPGLDLAGFRRGLPGSAGAAPAPATPPPGGSSLVIGRAGRGDVVLAAAGDRLRGQVRGRAVDLRITATRITGRIGGDEVLIWIMGSRRAEGTVGGRPLGFTFNPTRQGWIAGASLPDLGGRVELDPARLSFLPGCDRPLAAVAGAPGRYQGTCADGAAARIDLPAAFTALPPLAQLVVLGMLLPERDPILPEAQPPLFPRP